MSTVNHTTAATPNEYELGYLKIALSSERLPEPEKTKCGTYHELLASIYDASIRGGIRSAREAWMTAKRLIPALSDLNIEYNNRIPDQMRIIGQGNGWFITPAADLQHLPKISWLIPSKIPSRGLTVLYGPSGTYKSFVAIDYALQIAQTSSVVYMAGEGEHGYQKRIVAWTRHNHKPIGKLYMALGAIPVMEDLEVSTFIDVCKPLHPSLVIIDTLARAMVGSDENSSRDMGMFLKACNLIEREIGCAVMLVHHTNKGGIQERGSGALRGASDAMLRIEALDDEITLECAKSKDEKPFDTEYYRFLPVIVDDSEDTSGVLVPTERIKDDPRAGLTLNQNKVLTAIHEILDGEADANEIVDVTNIPRGSIVRVLARLKKLGFIAQTNKRQPYTITPEGIKSLGNESVESIESHES